MSPAITRQEETFQIQRRELMKEEQMGKAFWLTYNYSKNQFQILRNISALFFYLGLGLLILLIVDGLIEVINHSPFHIF